MRIHVNLPVALAAARSNVASTSIRSLAPPPLTALAPDGELLLIELQGSLEIENQSPTGGQVLGTISFEPTRPDRPILMISHHRLEGKFVNLVKPLAVLEKKVRKDPAHAQHDVLVELANGKRSAQQASPITPKRARCEQDNATPWSPPLAPPLSPRRGRDALDFSSSPPRHTPIRQKPVKQTFGLEHIVENTATLLDSTQEQHPKPSKVQDHDDDDGNKDNDDDDDEYDDDAEPQTAVYYDVVNVIKRKILFSKRPEPIVRLNPSFTT